MVRRNTYEDQIVKDHARNRPIRMTLANGRSRAFQNLRDAREWADAQKNHPKNDARIAVSVPTEVKEFVRDSGQMSPQVRALIEKAIGAAWKSMKEPKKQEARVTKLRPGRPKKVRYA